MRPIAPITLTVDQSVPIETENNEKWAVLYNESPFTLTVSTAMGARTLPAWTGDLFQLTSGGGGGTFTVLPQAVLAQANPPAFSLTGDVFYDTERPQGVYPIALARQVSVGNQVATTNSNSVINDGNAAGTQVVEGTPSGASTSQLKLNNDGSAILGGGHLTIDNLGNVAGAAIAASEIGAGYPAADLGAGTLAAGVSVPGGQVAGSVPSATTASHLAAGGALNGNATIPRGDFLEDASDAATQIGVAGDGAAEVISQNHEALLSSDTFTRVRYNAARAAGGGDTYMDSTNPAIDWFLHPDHEHWWQHQFAAPGVAGNPISWTSSGFTAIQIGISGSATATVSHGLNFTPWVALVNTFNGSNSTTFGSGSYTSSSVFIFEFNSQAWRGMVIA